MTTKSVANNRLQNASRRLWLDPFSGQEPTYDPDGNRITFGQRWLADDHESLVNCVFMPRITVDGLSTQRCGGYGYYIFSIKSDHTCTPDSEGYCDCRPSEYKPLSYRAGEICETCWLKHGLVFGIGKDGCDHSHN